MNQDTPTAQSRGRWHVARSRAIGATRRPAFWYHALVDPRPSAGTSQAAPIPPPDRSSTARRSLSIVFVQPIPCIHCDYDLNTIPLTDPCPECGTPSADSLDSLAAAEPWHIRRARVGILLLLIAGFGVPLLAIFLALPTFFSLFGRGGSFGLFMFGLLLLCVGPAIALSGCFALTSPINPRSIPGPIRPQPAAHCGLAIKRCGIAHFLLCAALGLGILIVSDTSRSGGALQFVTGTFMALALLAWDLRNHFLCRSFATLALRSNARGTHTLFRWGARICSWLFIAHGLQGLSTLLLFLFSSALNTSPPRYLEQLGMIVMIVQSALQFITIAWCLAWPVLLAILYRRLGQAYACAQAIDGPLVQPRTEPDASLYTTASAPPETPPSPHAAK